MGYSNINAAPNYQLQGFGQSGMRTISTSQAYVEGEYYRVLQATQDSYISATSVIGDDLVNEFVYAGTTIYGLFTAVSVTSGELVAYLAGATEIDDVWAYINAYGLTNGATIEAADCAKDAIAPLLDKYYAQASLVVVPSLYKTSIVYAERPLTTDGQLAFTRASEATRVGPDGLIEKVRTNLQTYSQDFSNAAWVKTRTTVSTNATTSPSGTITADKIIANIDNNSHFIDQPLTTPINTPFTVSIFAKAGEYGFMQINNQADNSIANFNLTNGTLGTISGYTASITSVGDGWYRCIATRIFSTAPTTHRFALITSSTSIRLESFAGDGTSGIFVWGAQAELNDIATDYIATTSAAVSVGPVNNLPRLDYPINEDGSVGCPSLLLEPQTTALNQFSEQIDNAYWTKTDVTISANTTATLDPSGYNGADKVVEAATTNYHSFQRLITTAVTSHTFSVFAKAAERSIVYIEVFTSGASNRTFFDLSNGTIGTSSAGNDATITNYGNGWYRLSVTRSTGASSVFIVGVTTADNVLQYAGNGTSGAYLWGLNCTQTSYLQSYIPTLSTSVTRVGEQASKTGLQAAGVFGATAGSVMLDFQGFSEDSNQIVWQIQDASASQILRLYYKQEGACSVFQIYNSINLEFVTANFTLTTNPKIAIVWDGTSRLEVFGNGAKITRTGGLFSSNAVADGIIKVSTNSDVLNIKQLLIFPTALTDAQAIELTSL